MSLPQFGKPGEYLALDFLCRILPEAPAWEDRVGVVSAEFMYVQCGLIDPLEREARQAAQEAGVIWWLDDWLKSVPVRETSQPSPPPLPAFPPPQQATALPAPPTTTAADVRLPAFDIGRKYSHAEVTALIREWAIPSNEAWPKAVNSALIREMVRALTKSRPDFRTLDQLWVLLVKRLEARHGVVKHAGAIRTQWQRNLRAVTGVDERRKQKPGRLATSLLPGHRKEGGGQGAKRGAGKVGTPGGLKGKEKKEEKEVEKPVAETGGRKRKKGWAKEEMVDPDLEFARTMALGLRERKRRA